tara:strand:+ start:299 stop:1627 length:1329 start_codon:yes stop_codon:yes gene_type:complete
MSTIHLSPLDDRYRAITGFLKDYFSEYGLFKYRLKVELKYFVELIKLKLPELENLNIFYISAFFTTLINGFNETEYNSIKKIERKINHDVKALEYYIADKFKVNGLVDHISFIHFGLTSQDINNTSISLSLKDFVETHYINSIEDIIKKINNKYNDWNKIVMLGHTHGQPAVPTTLGKEFRVFSYRLELQLELLKTVDYYGKFGGASGNLNAHKLAYPNIDWEIFGVKFMQELKLKRSKYTTQIDNYDNLAVLFDNLRRINTILIDMCQDIWLYISKDYIKQKLNKDEVGSSTMPHKVNPINFENAEGNLLLANNFLEFFSRKLPVSRLQRDLTDSTILRNIGTLFGHIYVAFDNINKGLGKLDVNKKKIQEELENNYVVITEGIQTILRKHGHNNAYELLKEFSRNGETLTKDNIYTFIDKLDVHCSVKNELKKINIMTYI